jgi:plastocyanin
MKTLPSLLTFLLLACTLPAQSVIEGTVELPKSKSAPVVAKRYDVVTRGGVVATNPPLAVVYLEGNFPKPAKLPTRQVEQKNLAFIPVLLPIEAGTRVEFPNLDDTYHNIFSYSPAKRFDLGRYRPEERPIPSQVFEKPGLVTLRCDIHDHMRGLILVLDTPYFTVTEPSGKFRLTGLPAGHFVLKAWLSSSSTLQVPVDLKSGATTRVNLP